MDKVGFLAANSAANAMARQENVANNIANINTNGFRSTIMAMQSTPLIPENARGEARLNSRTYAAETVVGFDNRPGTMQNTGRPLDMAIQSEGWFAVQRPGGGEGYTRAGAFQVNQEGVLVSAEGLPVLGQGGAQIEIPAGAAIRISEGGLVSAFDNGAPEAGFVEVGQLRLVNPNPANMERGNDGFFQTVDGAAAPQAENVRVMSGFLEGSNVNPATAMVEMIAAQRSFNMSMKAVATAKEDDQKADGALRAS
ncbi:MAG: flagellar basal-body rod protein FlgF [Limnobacter sp.]|nr:flagellar basal-body rod protein FlgF [Limnobacter sp.]